MRIFQRIFTLGNFWGGVSRYAATALIVDLSPGHSYITRLCPRSPIATGNHLDRAEKNSKIYSEDWHCWLFWSAFRHFGTHFAESFHISETSWSMDPTCSREMPTCSAFDLAEIRRPSKIWSRIWSVTSGVGTVWVVQDEAHHRWKNSQSWTGPPSFWRWHTMVHIPWMFLSDWREFHFAPCLAGKKKIDESSRPDVVEIAHFACHASFRPL